MENLKAVIVGTLSALAAYLSPIESIIFSILYMFGINFVFGLLEGMAVKGESFSIKKAVSTMKEVLIYFLIVLSVYIVGEKMNDSTGALQAITGVTYAFIYFYAVNILRNLTSLFPSSLGIKFVYYCVSMEFVKKIPFLDSFIKREEGKQ